MSSVSRSRSWEEILTASPVSPINRLKASAVVTNPSGTRTPSSDRLPTISPSDVLFPQAGSMSLKPMSPKALTFTSMVRSCGLTPVAG